MPQVSSAPVVWRDMADVISLAEHRANRRRATAAGTAGVPRRRGAFFFDLASPFTYLAVERIDRLFPGARWVPASGEALHRGDPWSDPVARAAADRRGRRAPPPPLPPPHPSRPPGPTVTARGPAVRCAPPPTPRTADTRRSSSSPRAGSRSAAGSTST